MGRRLAIVAVLIVSVLATPGAAADEGFQVIVHPSNPSTTLKSSFVADAFLRKVGAWPGGETIKPVDLARDASARRGFSEAVLKRSVSAVKSYWQQVIFSGRGLPPPELDSEEAVIRYVTENEGAIGYVSGSADVGAAKIVSVR